ncbi:Mothers against decapentaplegic-like protein 6 [Anas platyrhynchos]|uniref:Mothers against decapentaplegic-like protein 6 n=1 Tax=Anas platyrhynchos TaxID=8839 RepID=R0LV75_ANAPL|nr:Mothers against decapentaplegic-like protein 6 [Anas platyrhynchos]
MGEFVSLCPHVPVSLLAARDLSRGREPCGWVPSPADLSDSTLSYTETEATNSPNVTPGEFSALPIAERG